MACTEVGSVKKLIQASFFFVLGFFKKKKKKNALLKVLLKIPRSCLEGEASNREY